MLLTNLLLFLLQVLVCIIDFIYPPKPLYKTDDDKDKKEDKDSGDELVGIFFTVAYSNIV